MAAEQGAASRSRWQPAASSCFPNGVLKLHSYLRKRMQKKNPFIQLPAVSTSNTLCKAQLQYLKKVRWSFATPSTLNRWPTFLETLKDTPAGARTAATCVFLRAAAACGRLLRFAAACCSCCGLRLAATFCCVATCWACCAFPQLAAVCCSWLHFAACSLLQSAAICCSLLRQVSVGQTLQVKENFYLKVALSLSGVSRDMIPIHSLYIYVYIYNMCSIMIIFWVILGLRQAKRAIWVIKVLRPTIRVIRVMRAIRITLRGGGLAGNKGIESLSMFLSIIPI